jgi:SAM-dependent methyltransferase
VDYVARARAGVDPFAHETFGTGMDERVVEIPLALGAARLHEPGEVLDAGSALNLALVHAIVGRPEAHVTHFTLPGSAEPPLPAGADRYQQSFGDLRSMPFADGSFQRVVCVSTLEHVGLDTTRFGAEGVRAPETATAAVAELARVLAPGGTLLLTVPYGQAADHGWFRIFDCDGLAWLLAPLAGLDVRTRYFFYQGGWAEGPATPPASLVPPPYAADVITGVAVIEATRTAA